MKKIIFCKYNLNRSPEFQTKTIICQDRNKKYVEKYALTEVAKNHMATYKENFHLVEKLYLSMKLFPVEEIEDGVRYPYINGISIDDVLRKKVNSTEKLLLELKKILESIYVVNEEFFCEFHMTKEFKRIFGDINCEGDACIAPCNLDVVFDNLILADEKVCVFDYEWVFNFPVPQKYVLYRVLCRFYDKYLHYLEKHFSFEDYISHFDFTEDEKKRYRKMEDAFITYVFSEGDVIFQNSFYKKERTNLEQVKNLEVEANELKIRVETLQNDFEKAVNDYNGVIEVLHSTEKEYLLTIERLDEAARLQIEAEGNILKLIEEIDEKNKTIEACNEHLNIMQQSCNEIQRSRDEAQKAYEEVINSSSWKITKPLRVLRKGIYSIKNDGLIATVLKIRNHLKTKADSKSSRVVDKIKSQQLISLIEVDEEIKKEQKVRQFKKKYKISIITPLFNTPENFLIELLESVKSQTYVNWELCLVNFSTTDFDRVDKICREYEQKDKRISYHTAMENKGISENTNICISYATGEYIGLLDHDDILHPCALYEVMRAIEETGADFIYTDEVKFTDNIKNVFSPNFKPDFSSDELRAHNYICHFNVYKASLYQKVGGYRKEFDGSQDHDIVLRLTEKAKKIIHIPQILYYWRVHPNSVAQSIDAKSYATDAGASAVTEQLERMGEDQYAESIINNIPVYRICAKKKEEADITVVIWNGDNEHYVRQSMDSIQKLQKCKCIVLKKDEKQSLGEQWNKVMKTVQTKYVLFLHAGLQLIPENFENEIILYNRRNDIATIDCKIITKENTLYSGGAYLSSDIGMPIKLRCMGGPRNYSGYENGMLHNRNVTASTGLCTLVNVALWKQTEGFANENFMNIMLDYSYQMWKNGKSNLWTPFIEAIGLNKEEQQKFIDGLIKLSEKEYDKKDVYFSEHILKLHLE